MFCKKCGNKIKDNQKFCTNCGDVRSGANSIKTKSKLVTKNNLIVSGATLLSIIILFTIYIFFQDSKTGTSAKEQKDQDIASAVVNIYCVGKTEKDSTGGSGTILTEDGLILTNAHIIPDGAEKTVSCLVILPDPLTGVPDEIYTAYPIVVPDLSEKYDLAFVQVDDVFYDEKEGKAYGVYPKKFPSYESSRYCKNTNLKLGEAVRVYGYPAISGGYALTITDGIISSLLPSEGLIITSAKISHGNSGGLAVDQNGCRIGIPSMVSGDDYESLGVIISSDMIYKFVDELQTLYNK
jgi:S1-C subfamily serine protease